MVLIKYRDEMNGETEYSWFWVHDFGDGVEKVVSETFSSKENAERWANNFLMSIKEVN